MAKYNQIITAKGKRSQLQLSDGTMLWVNSATRVIYPTQFSETEREIYVDGEIYIEVAKENKRKFIVKTKDFSVQVLGTKFNVSSYENNAISKVLLVEGKVSVKKDKIETAPIIMSPHELLELDEKMKNNNCRSCKVYLLDTRIILYRTRNIRTSNNISFSILWCKNSIR